MNRKLIAVAVAGVVAAPAAYADISAYGRINNRIAISDNDDIDMQTSGSRFGFKGSGDIGNGMSAFARYEFGTTTDTSAGGGSGINRRLAFVGLSGPFGSVSLGQQWSAYFQNFGTHASLNMVGGPGQLGVGRTGNTIQYANQFGPVSLKLDARVDDAGDGGKDGRGWAGHNGNGFGGGVTITPMDNITLAAAFDSSEGAKGMYDMRDAEGKLMKKEFVHEDSDLMGVAAIVNFGGFTLTAAHEQRDTGEDKEEKNTLLWLGTSVDQLSMRVGFGQTETTMTGSPNAETDQLTVIGVYNLGGGVKLWGQFRNVDAGAMDEDHIHLGVRMDF